MLLRIHDEWRAELTMNESIGVDLGGSLDELLDDVIRLEGLMNVR